MTGEPKTTLTLADRDKVWRAVERPWLHYAWAGGQWRCYPCDPRSNPYVMSFPAYQQRLRDDGVLTRQGGLIEVGNS
jgi:hypothetical protein